MHNSIESLLEKNAGTARLLAHARLLQKLSRRYAAMVPAGLAQASRVANFKSGTVVIHADNGAVAAKLRQMSQRLSDAFRQSGVQCNGIEVKVQPTEIPCQSSPSHVKPLTARSAAALRGMAAGLQQGSPLRAALEHLLAHASIVEGETTGGK